MSFYAKYPVSGGGGVATYPTFADFPASAPDGTLALALDTDILYAFNAGSNSWVVIGGSDVVLGLGPFGSTPNADGLSIAANLLNMQPADGTHPGGVSILAQTFAGAKTFSTAPILSSLTASTALVLDSSKNIASLGYGSANTASTLVERDGSGNFSAGTITASLTGAASLNLLLTGGTLSGALNLSSNQINSVANPTSAQDAATKNYVDTVASGLQTIQAVTYASASTNYPGTMVGNVLTITATGAISIDGSTPAANARVLLKDQSTQSQNGVYVVTVVGSVGVSPVLTRAADYNTAADVNAGDLIPVLSGTVNATTSWLQTATVVTLNTDPLVFAEWTANPANYLLKTNNLSDVSSKSTSFNNISPMTTGGDLIYGGASGAGTRLANGSAGQFLQSAGTTLAPTWATVIALTNPTTGSTYGNSTSTGPLTGTDVTAYGVGAGIVDSSGGSNTLIGYNAGSILTTGARNTVLGAGTVSGANNATDQVIIGNAAGASASSSNGDVIIGSLAQGNISNQTANTTSATVSIGYSANGNASYAYNNTVTVGAFSSAGGNNSVVLGCGVQTNSANCFVVGRGGNTVSTNYIATSAANQISFGTSTQSLKDMFIGSGALGVAAPVAASIQPTPVLSGTSNTAGANLTILGGNSTGTGAGGSILFNTAAAGSTGSTPNTLRQVASLDSTGALSLGVNTTLTGVLNLATSVGSGQSISVKNGGATTAYNFNLPTTVGSAGTVLTSQGGGSTAMTWSSVVTNPMTTLGDIIVGGASGTPARLPVGTNGQTLVADSTATDGVAYHSNQDFKNLIVNGGFDWWQAGTSFTVTSAANPTSTPTYKYGPDQWYVNNVLGGGTIQGVITISQGTGSIFPGSASGTYAMQAQITTAPTGTNIQNGCEIYQVLDNETTKNFLFNTTASFGVWVTSFNHVNQIGIQFCYATSEVKPTVFIGSEQLFTVNTTSATLCTINGQALGTSMTSSGVVGVRIRITGVSSGNTYDVSNGLVVQGGMINTGSVAMPFQRNGVTAQADLLNCYRYYEQSYDPTTAPGTTTTNGCIHLSAANSSLSIPGTFRVTKRANPVVTVYSPATGATGKVRDVTSAADDTASSQTIGLNNFSISTTTTATHEIEAHWVANAQI